MTIVVLFLILFPMAFAQTSCSDFASLDRGYNDIGGIPYNNESMATPQQCCSACDSNPKCSAWALSVPPGSRPGCWQKFPTPPTIDVQPPCEPYCFSGHKAYPSGPFEVGYDRYGYDMAWFGLADGAPACAQACSMTPGCKSWTFVAKGGPNEGCHLKNQIPGKTQMSGCGNYCTSGVLPPYTPPLSCGAEHAVGYDRVGWDYKTLVTDGPDGCCAACADDHENCASWTYVEAPPFDGCHLKSSLPPLQKTCDQCTSSGYPQICNSANCRETINVEPSCGAWIIWRLLKGPIPFFIHQSFAYDNNWNKTKQSLLMNSGVYGCGYYADNLAKCGNPLFCGLYCLSRVCSDPDPSFQILLSSDGLSDTKPNEQSYTCWFLDPAKGQSLDCDVLRRVENNVRNDWNYCSSESATEYSFTERNCRHYVVTVMSQYCSIVGQSAPPCQCM